MHETLEVGADPPATQLIARGNEKESKNHCAGNHISEHLDVRAFGKQPVDAHALEEGQE